MGLEEIRKERNLTRQEVSQALGVSQQAIYNAERNQQISKDLLIALADFFCVTTDSILGRTNCLHQEESAKCH